MSIAPRIGRWEAAGEDVVLIGSHCTSCDENLFPERPVCSRCGRRTLEEARFCGPATLMSYTVVHQVPAGFAGPVVVGYGILPDGLVVLAPVDAAPEDVRSGMKLVLHEGVTSSNADGTEFRTYRYRPMDEADA